MLGSRCRQVLRVAVQTLLMLLALVPMAANAANAMAAATTQASCWAASTPLEMLASVARSEPRWLCGNRAYTIDAERVLLRFEIAPGQTPPRYLLSRRSALEAIHLLAIDADGSERRASFAPGQLQNAKAGGYFSLPLAVVTDQTRLLIIAFDKPTHRMVLEQAHLASTDGTDGTDGGPATRRLLLLAGLCGMLIMPLIFNMAFYHVLREPFVLWHGALAVALLLSSLVTSELGPALLDLPAMTLSWMTTLVFGMTIAAGVMFTRSFVEPGCMSPGLRRALTYCAVAALALSTFHAAFPYVARSVQSTLYTAAFGPILVIVLCSQIDALRRGSRAARFQVVGWAPLLLVGLVRLVTGVVPGLTSNDAETLFHIGCVFEVLSTTLGVADRFMTLRHERDQAQTEAAVLERLSVRDALTGLLNRRAIETRFGQFRANGYDTLAVLDLDHFKSINDQYGHGVGDAVLKATAEALRTDAQVQAFRLGGEEFVLLLRGDDGPALAERRRQAIPTRVAAAVPGLARPVTASMGVIRLARSPSLDTRFQPCFDRADRQLYLAKGSGRNRSSYAQEPADRPHPGAAASRSRQSDMSADATASAREPEPAD